MQTFLPQFSVFRKRSGSKLPPIGYHQTKPVKAQRPTTKPDMKSWMAQAAPPCNPASDTPAIAKPTCTSKPASWRSPTSGKLPQMEYGLLSPSTSFVASLSFLKAGESRLHAIPCGHVCMCACEQVCMCVHNPNHLVVAAFPSFLPSLSPFLPPSAPLPGGKTIHTASFPGLHAALLSTDNCGHICGVRSGLPQVISIHRMPNWYTCMHQHAIFLTNVFCMSILAGC